jgi:hypothetical protein
MKTAPTNKKIREIIQMVREERLIPRPEFQRRLVWAREDKDRFLDSILRGYPFPEIYLADGDVDLDSGGGSQLLVDGLQRVNTILQYFEGSVELKLLTVNPYKELSEDQKKAFLQYDVAVRDLGSISKEQIIEVFKRINATKYSLEDIEINNAVYSGAMKRFAANIASNNFFSDHNIFNASDYRRMGDLRFALLIITTMIGGYYNRDDEFESFLKRYNDDFDQSDQINERLNKIFDFLDECGFDQKSRIWRKADLFTTIIELDRYLNVERNPLEPSIFVDAMQEFFLEIQEGSLDQNTIAGVYHKAALQASNDRANRERRAIITYGLISQMGEQAILDELSSRALLRTLS